MIDTIKHGFICLCCEGRASSITGLVDGPSVGLSSLLRQPDQPVPSLRVAAEAGQALPGVFSAGGVTDYWPLASREAASQALSLSNAPPAGVACVSCASLTRSKARRGSPATIAPRAASRSRHASTAIVIRRERSAPHREQIRAPRKRAWQTGQRLAALAPLNSADRRSGLP